MHDLNSSDIEGILGHFQCVPGVELHKINIYVEYTILTHNTSTFKCEHRPATRTYSRSIFNCKFLSVIL